nr:uncharacterized protein LOC106683911 [Halyomorpha halys]
MMMLIAALLYVGVASGAIINIDHQVDTELEALNLFNKFNNDTILSIPGDTINENVSYSNGYLSSWGTLQRTAHCSLYKSQDSDHLSYDLHIGLKFFATLFGKIDIGNRDTAGYFQIDDNSVHFGISFTNQTVCTVALYALAIERFEKVKFSVSNGEFEKFDFESFFKTEVFKKVNWILATLTPTVQTFFQKGLCNNRSNGHNHSLKRILILIQNLFTKF